MFALALVVVWSSAAYCDHRTGMQEDLSEWGELAPIRDKTGVSLAPILAVDPSFGTIFGGAVFLDRPADPHYFMYTRLALSTEGETSIQFNYKRWLKNGIFYHLDAEVDDFARPYYGEGMDTDKSERILLEGTVARVQYFLKYIKNGKLVFGPFLDFRSADHKGTDGTDVSPPEYGESTLGVGLCLFYDSRDNPLSPTRGVYDTLTFRLLPDELSSFEGSENFIQAEVDHRIFYSPKAGTTLAGRLFAGGTWGQPSYQYRYYLGGPYFLRGFYTNRFRGDSIYVAQAEVRQDLFWIFSGAAFVEAGEVTDDKFDRAELSAGVGVRMTLPPDHVAKVRLDAAWAKDQYSIYFIFGEAF
jgi:outer membrane protein assembly factor BamA